MGLSFNTIKASTIYHVVLIVVALIIIVDFSFPTTPMAVTVVDVKTTQQQYYNAGGNMHFSYSIITEDSSFSVSETFAREVQKKDTINVYRSIILNEVNAIKSTETDLQEIYSLRWFTGMIIPLVLLLLCIQKLIGIKRLNTVFLIAQIIFFMNVAFLITRAFYN